MVTLFTSRFYLKCCLHKHLPVSFRVLSHTTENEKLHACYFLLGVPENSDLDVVRDAYLKLAKQHHPDTGSKAADAKKFSRIDAAYKTILQHHQKNATKPAEGEAEEPAIFDIKHTAPQHRQYLNYEGVGFGSPSKREQQYKQYRVMRAAENVSDYRIAKFAAETENAMVVKDKADAKKKKIRNAIDRLVEDLILESMSRGEFDNLPGQGKPLAYYNHNPMVDTTTHNLNRILIENGYAPEWVMLKKEIRKGIQEARDNLLKALLKIDPDTNSPKSKRIQENLSAVFRDSIELINKNIHKYNMVVPTLHQQLMPYDVNKELRKIFDKYKEKVELGEVNISSDPEQVTFTSQHPEEKIRLRDVVREIKILFLSS